MKRLTLTAEDMADLIAGHTINVILDNGEEVVVSAPDGVNVEWTLTTQEGS